MTRERNAAAPVPSPATTATTTARSRSATTRAIRAAGQTKTVFDGCRNCRFVPIRVADDFVGEGNDLAQGLVYAADAKVNVASVGLFTVDQTAFTKAAVDYAYSKNVLIVTGI